MSKLPPTPASSKRPTPAPSASTAAVDDDPFGGAFGSLPTPAPAKAPPSRGALPKPPPPTKAAPTPAKSDAPYGTAGMPEDVRIATGAKGSEVFGAPPPKSPPAVGRRKPPPKAAVAGGPQKGGDGPQAPTPPRTLNDELGDEYRRTSAARQAAAAAGKPVGLERPIHNTAEAAAYLEETWRPFADLTHQQRVTRNYCFELIVREREVNRDMLRAIIGAETPVNVPPLSEEEEGQQANSIAEELAGMAHGALPPPAATEEEGDPFGMEAFGEESEAPEVALAEYYVFPTGVKLTWDDLVTLVLRYPNAGLKAQGDIERNLGLQFTSLQGQFKSLKGLTVESQRRSTAEVIAQQILDLIPPTDPGDDPDGDGDEEDFEDGGIVMDEQEGQEAAPVRELTVERFDERRGPAPRQEGGAGRKAPSPVGGGGLSRQDAFEGAKLALRNRALTLICARCSVAATGHKSLTGHNVALPEKCPAFVPANDLQKSGLHALAHDMAHFKEEFADLLAQQQPATPKSGGGSQPVRPSVGKGAGRATEYDGGGSVGRGPDEAVGAREGAGAGRDDAGAESSPAEQVRAAEDARVQWAIEHGDIVTGKWTWGLNYPPSDDPTEVAQHLGTAGDEGVNSRRTRMVTKVAQYLDKSFLPFGNLKDGIEYGSTSWRVIVGARTLARAIEMFARNGDPTKDAELTNSCERAAKNYVAAHIPTPDDVYDPDFVEYVAWCEQAGKPVGTPIEEVMGQ